MPFVHGLTTGAALIIAIGAQSSFILSNGIRKNRILTIILICSLCDAVLISTGISGVGALINSRPLLAQLTLWGGSCFLFAYGLRSLFSAVKGGRMEPAGRVEDSLATVVLSTLAVTLLNPHVYLDTMVLIGSIGARFNGQERLLFAAGAICASCLWFALLGFGGRKLAPLFRSNTSWRILDTMLGLLMFSLGISLFLHQPAV
ncbi:LysE/ArgO family amino acid transporter [Desulfogranum mediterraneum]|uniref:LysE/ArgO family amino acid transporter n=1 Tax=Desulfogranum mediterraneum TaxID=160661 RepID=UPI000419F598|nr:LysE/ArgO family amino acid transporter [Desulfogranum mediterraneum]